ncbi:Protein alan shepard [Smittium culicis]|uniref:Protein alan shepard n=1 Tax=Smittium culicis TaxID=133412 RepID=A0A1R1YIK9_9FUNG|nr:Protein alan shepard [Smittium culicis]
MKPSDQDRTYTKNNDFIQRARSDSFNDFKIFPDKNKSRLDNSSLHDKNVYVRGLPSDFTDDDLQRLASEYGNITSIKTIINEDTKKCKGYGFIMYESVQQAENAIKCLNSLGYQTSFAKDLIELFNPHQILSARILRENDSSRRVGFARMASREDAEQIIKLFNLKNIEGCEEPLKVKFADTNEQKKIKRSSYSKQPTPADAPIIYSPIIVYQPGSPVSGYAYPDNYYERQNSQGPNMIPTIGLASPVYYPSPGYASPIYSFHPGSPNMSPQQIPQIYSPYPIYPQSGSNNFSNQNQNQNQSQNQQTSISQPFNQASNQNLGQYQQDNQQIQMQLHQQHQYAQQYQHQQHYQQHQLVRNHDGSYSQYSPAHSYGSPPHFSHSGFSSPGYMSPICLSPKPVYASNHSSESYTNNRPNEEKKS